MSKRKRKADSTEYPDSSQEGWSDGCGKGRGKRKPMPWHRGRTWGGSAEAQIIRTIVYAWAREHSLEVAAWAAEMGYQISTELVEQTCQTPSNQSPLEQSYPTLLSPRTFGIRSLNRLCTSLL